MKTCILPETKAKLSKLISRLHFGNKKFKQYFLVICGGIIIFSLFISAGCHAEPIEDVTVVYYDIDPANEKDIYAALMRNSTIRYQGKTYFGYTKWDIKWRYRWQESSDSCRIVHTRVYLTVVHTMPRLPDKGNFDAHTTSRFKGFYDALVAHEKGHYRLGSEAARKIDKQINKFIHLTTRKEML